MVKQNDENLDGLGGKYTKTKERGAFINNFGG